MFRLEAEFLGLCEIRFRLGFVTHLFVGNAPAVIRLGIFRIQSDGLVVVGNGLVIFALVYVGNATIVISIGVLRVESNSRIEVRYGFVEVALLSVDEATIVISIDELRIEPKEERLCDPQRSFHVSSASLASAP